PRHAGAARSPAGAGQRAADDARSSVGGDQLRGAAAGARRGVRIDDDRARRRRGADASAVAAGSLPRRRGAVRRWAMEETIRDAIVREISAWPGVTTARHRFGGIEFRY